MNNIRIRLIKKLTYQLVIYDSNKVDEICVSSIDVIYILGLNLMKYE